ncbi:hypothetical protein DOY81_007223, partial [Sarcophaga bullata]
MLATNPFGLVASQRGNISNILYFKILSSVVNNVASYHVCMYMIHDTFYTAKKF